LSYDQLPQTNETLCPLPSQKNKKIKVVNYKYQINNIMSSIDPFMITEYGYLRANTDI
jgi:hypothetical protein